jgi:hypothetical protein
VIIWLNGPFGIGKTTTAHACLRRLPQAVLFDPEPFGTALRHTVESVETVTDLQDLRGWPDRHDGDVPPLRMERRPRDVAGSVGGSDVRFRGWMNTIRRRAGLTGDARCSAAAGVDLRSASST